MRFLWFVSLLDKFLDRRRCIDRRSWGTDRRRGSIFLIRSRDRSHGCRFWRDILNYLHRCNLPRHLFFLFVNSFRTISTVIVKCRSLALPG
jgi:hypothetical protein